MLGSYLLAWAGLAAGLAIVGYFQGPGWLPHSECPFCCWCGGGVPFGERVERRVVKLVDGDPS